MGQETGRKELVEGEEEIEYSKEYGGGKLTRKRRIVAGDCEMKNGKPGK